MPDQFANLKSLDPDTLQRVFGDELAGHEQDARRELAGDRTHRRTPAKRTLVDARQVANAVQHIGRLPAPGETIHLVCAGGYSLYHHIEAVLQIAAPATIRYLGIATLGFSKENLERLIGLLDAGTVGQVDFLFSVYFKSNEREICERLAHELGSRGPTQDRKAVRTAKRIARDSEGTWKRGIQIPNAPTERTGGPALRADFGLRGN